MNMTSIQPFVYTAEELRQLSNRQLFGRFMLHKVRQSCFCNFIVEFKVPKMTVDHIIIRSITDLHICNVTLNGLLVTNIRSKTLINLKQNFPSNPRPLVCSSISVLFWGDLRYFTGWAFCVLLLTHNNSSTNCSCLIKHNRFDLTLWTDVGRLFHNSKRILSR